MTKLSRNETDPSVEFARYSDFLNLVAATNEIDECWNWVGPLDDAGYGEYMGIPAHRYMMLYMNKGSRYSVKLSKLDVIQKCGNPLCCNPQHLRYEDES